MTATMTHRLLSISKYFQQKKQVTLPTQECLMKINIKFHGGGYRVTVFLMARRAINNLQLINAISVLGGL